jgi:S1-C subfamily serine protease
MKKKTSNIQHQRIADCRLPIAELIVRCWAFDVRCSMFSLIVLLGVLLGAGISSFAASPNAARAMGTAIADAVERVMPAVVVIRTESVVYRPARDLFRGRIFGVPEWLEGLGSGVIINTNGYVLTSSHVIQKADIIEIVLNDGKKYRATLVGQDPATDLAVLKIQTEENKMFPTVEIGDSDALRVGEFVIAIGSPFSLDSSVTLGIVSQKGRYMGLLPYEDFIQTDASINPGNSGGPLVDVDGRMVGINSIIQVGGPQSQGNIGIGFAVPINMAMNVADSIIRTGKVIRSWIGVRLGKLSEEDYAQLPDIQQGVMVVEVIRRSPADKVGLKQGDIITQADGKPVSEPRDLQLMVIRHQPGDILKLVVFRLGKWLEVELPTEQMPEF